MSNARRYFIAFVSASLVGTALHFGYNLFPSPLMAIFCPVNESIWEHLKLSFWPYLLSLYYLWRGRPTSLTTFFAANFTALLLAPLIVVMTYYTCTGAFHMEGGALGILIYYLAMAAAYFTAYKLSKNEAIARALPVLAFSAACLMLMLILFTFYPPDLPIFIDNNTGKAGIQ